MPARRRASDHAPEVAGRRHGESHNGVAPQPTRQPLLEVGDSCVAHMVLIITHTPPPEPWVELRPEAVARFKYPTRCLTHKCPEHTHKDPIYMALHAPGALMSELGPALRTHLREHFGGHATLCPHRAPVASPMNLQPRTEPEIWFHDLPPLATICGAIMATDACTTPAGMTMAIAYESARGEYIAVTTSGMGTSQEGEALTPRLCVRQLAAQQRTYLQCLLCGSRPETAQHLWECPVQAHEWRPARQHLHSWLNTYVRPRASQMQGQLWDPTVLEQRAAAITTPSLRTAHRRPAGPHDIGTEFIRQEVMESHKGWFSHANCQFQKAHCPKDVGHSG